MMSTMNNRSSSNIDYTLYKYSDLNPSSIRFQGHLNYRSDRSRLFKKDQFSMYYVVLVEVRLANQTNVMGLYLYRGQGQKPTNFFQLNEYERITDQCPKPIKSNYFLFALIGKDPNDVEIFGAHDAMEGDKWMKAIGDALQSTKIVNNNRNLNFSSKARRTHKDDPTNLDPTNAVLHLNYEPFEYDQSAQQPQPMRHVPEVRRVSVPTFPPPSAPPCERRPSMNFSTMEQPQYLTVDETKKTTLYDNDEVLYEQISEEKSFDWRDIFYDNENDDHAEVLNNIGQIGAFLVRPQLRTTSSKDHQYTLSILAFGGIIKYKIFNLRSGEVSLTMDDDEPNFSSIPELCFYYTTEALPRSTTKQTSKKPSVGDLQLKYPYRLYQKSKKNF